MDYYLDNTNGVFDESTVYRNINDYKFNDFVNYKSKEYYDFINKNFDKYSFPKNYSQLTYEEICEQPGYSLKPQQKFAGRIFNTRVQNNGILIFHGLGSGKTQTSIVIGEAFKFKTVSGDIIPDRADTQVLIVVPASLTDQYYAEIIGYIDKGIIKSASGEVVINGERQYYLNKKIRERLDQLNKIISTLERKNENLLPEMPEYESNERNILLNKRSILLLKDEENKNVRRVYEIMSHDKFLNQLYDNTDNEFKPLAMMKRLKVPNGLLIIDEAHRLVSSTGTSYRKLLFALKYHSHPKFRTVLLTGSPIYDKPYEIGLLINLLRPRIPFPDGQESFDEIFLTGSKEIKNVNLFKQMCSGYVSYFKGGNPEAYPYKKTIIMKHYMNPYQYHHYKNTLIKEVLKDKEPGDSPKIDDFLMKVATSESVDDVMSISVFNRSRLISNIAFPELTEAEKRNESKKKSFAEYGLDKFKKILLIERSNKQGQLEDSVKNAILKKVEEYSSKFASIARLIEKAEGPVFVYSNYVTYGVEAIAIVMNALGYYNFEKSSGGDRLKYFVWRGGLDQDMVSNARRIFNSMENKDGSLIKIMFGTQSVMEGVDFKRVRQVHILDPWWNDSRMQQVIARAIRLCSHSGLPESSRITDVFIHLSVIGTTDNLHKVIYNRNGEEYKAYTTLIPVNNTSPSTEWFYNQVSIKLKPEGYELLTLRDKTIFASEIVSIKKLKDPDLTRRIGDNWKNLDIDSVEEYMYFKSLKKLNMNRQFEYAIKQVSLDCEINKNGNIIRLDERYIPYQNTENLYNLEYENYSTGVKYLRLGVKSQFNGNIPENVLTLEDIFANTAKNSGLFQFKEISTGEIINFKKTLIIPEGIECENIEYSFTNMPRKIINLTINKELIKYLMKVDVRIIRRYILDIESGRVAVHDNSIIQKLRQFHSTKALNEKQVIVQKLRSISPETPWELESLEALKKIYKRLNKL